MRSFLYVPLLVLVFAGPALAASIVVPSGSEFVEGGGDTPFPFNAGISQRYQQVYDASEFTSFGLPVVISEITFRPDAGFFGSAFSTTITSIQINLSTTSSGPDALSMTFASNVGADDTVVFSGALSLSSADTGPGGGPKDFDIVITLQTTFLFDPTAGDLLLDVRNFSGEDTTQFDAVFAADTTSRTFSTSGGVNAVTADDFDSIGLVTKFTVTPIPEPRSALLFAAGALVVGVALRKKAVA